MPKNDPFFNPAGVPIEEARKQLGDLVRRVVAGEDICLTMRGAPVVMMQRLHARQLHGRIAYLLPHEAAEQDAEELVTYPEREEIFDRWGNDVDALMVALEAITPERREELQARRAQREGPGLSAALDELLSSIAKPQAEEEQ